MSNIRFPNCHTCANCLECYFGQNALEKGRACEAAEGKLYAQADAQQAEQTVKWLLQSNTRAVMALNIYQSGINAIQARLQDV